MIIYGAVSLVGNFVISFILTRLTVMANITGAGLFVSFFLLLFGGAIQVFTGILGVLSSKKPRKAFLYILFGILCLVIEVAILVTNLIRGNVGIVRILVSIPFGILVPILYIIGAVRNKKCSVVKK